MNPGRPEPFLAADEHSLSLRLKRVEDEMNRLRAAVACSLTALVDLKDFSTGTHSTRLAEWSVRVGKLFGLSESDVDSVETASILHDIGKIGVPDSILLKKGRLTSEEFAEIKKHPEYGWGVLRELPGFGAVANLVLYHHERLDGNGYPAGLPGSDIPLGARIVAVIDAFDAMTSTRVYRNDLGAEEAVRRLVKDSGTQFDPEVVSIFRRVLEADLGDVVRLSGASSGNDEYHSQS